MLLQTNNKEKPVLIPALILFFFTILAFWQVAFLTNSLQWDQIDCVLPWRYFTAECIHHHIFPFWNPYQNLGYPIYADMRSVWSPEVWIIGLIGGYSNYTLHFIFIVYIFLAGYGMYRLALNLGIKPVFSLIAGISYMLSGYFTGHAQEMFSITGGSLLPFVLLCYLKLLTYKRVKDVLFFVLFVFWMISSGYQAITIILIYLLLLFFIFTIGGLIREKKYKELIKLLGLNLMAVILIIGSCTFLIISIFQAAPYLQRIGGMDIKGILFDPFSPQSMISFLFPFSVVKEAAFFDTDLTMTNSYAGFFIFVFFIFSFFRKKSLTENIILCFGLFALIASFGRYTPLREWLYHFVPGMNLFRFPSFFSIFMLLAIILTGARSLEGFVQDPLKRKKAFFIILVIILSISGGFLAFSIKNIDFSHPGILSGDAFHKSTFAEHLFINVLVMLIFFSIFIFLIKKKKLRPSVILVLVALDMVVAVQLNAYYTVCSPDAKPSEMRKILKTQPTGFPIPNMNPVCENRDGGAMPSPFWRNTSIFRKQISENGFNSFQLSNYREFTEKHPVLKDSVLKNPIIYNSDHLFSSEKADNPVSKTDLFVDKLTYERLKNQQLTVNPSDEFKIISFSPLMIHVKTRTKNSSILTLLQNNFPGWEVRIDQHSVSQFTSNFMFISVVLPEGEHSVSFEYRNKAAYGGFLVTYGVVLLCGLVLIFIEISGYRRKKGVQSNDL